MTIETARLMDRIRRSDAVGHVEKVIKKKRCRRKARILLKRPVPGVSMTLQRLFESCREVFKGPGTVPSPGDVQKLCHILDGMKPEDVGLSRDLQFFNPKEVVEGSARVSYATIYQCESFSICIFFLPATAVIPLHNHPEMTVFNKLLLGTMHIKAYDWADPLNCDKLASPSRPRLARIEANRQFKAPCDTSVLYPTSGGNIHEFTAVTPCAVLDVMGPPYSKDDGRDCSYYKDTRCGVSSNGEEFAKVEDDEDCYGWLEEIEMPKESEMDGIEYLGPRVLDVTT
ncbi:Plant cysteine oxidase 1 [Abeliophyllum distichum]|uniref:cysteine dioxygenase n=1 Tax=Abeliophyllum distichum TaxID=126358 RepID=A0ABD1R035_9LAMI